MAGATLVRSIAFDRWITVLAAVLLLVGVMGARRDRVWGVALAYAAAVAFPVAWAIGIAPAWFVLVGAIGALPFVLASRAMVRFDARATGVLAMLGAVLGASGAIAWKECALDVFAAFPSLTPSLHAHHGAAILALLASAFVGRKIARGARAQACQPVAVRLAPHLRVAEVSETSTMDDDAADHAIPMDSSNVRHLHRP